MLNTELPPLPFEDEFLEFVYSISIFTHLPEDMQLAWLAELQRVTKRGGHLLLTTHGEHLYPTASEEGQKKLRAGGFHYAVGVNTEGLPDFYQTAYHSEEYIRREWGKFFEIQKIVKQGIADNQDLILCRRPD